MRIIRQILFLSLLFSTLCHAQKSAETLKLKYKVHTSSVNQVDTALLYVQSNAAFYIARYDDSATEAIGGTTASVMDPSGTLQMHYSKSSDSILYLGVMKTINPEGVIIGEKRESIKWELIDSLKVINGRSCKFAKGSFRGRSYHVWYDPELNTYEIGPWKLHGLPGALIYANDEEHYISFELTNQESLPLNKTPKMELDLDLPLVSRADHRAHQQKIFNRMKNLETPAEGLNVKIEIKIQQLERT